MAARKALPDGVFPTMITPFKPDRGGIDFDALQRLVDWYVASGVDGLFALCLSSEMYQLSSDERLALVRAVVAAAAGRVPVVACGAFGGPIEEQAAEVRRIGKEVDAVVIVVSQLAAPGEPDDVWIANAQKLLDLTADDEIPLGLYECPLPYHRLLSADMLAWAAKTGRFAFHKDTCCAKGPISAKLAAVRAAGEESPFKFYNANVATLKFSLEEGGNGFSGISANFYPWMHAWLCKNYASEPEKAEKVQRFLSVAENVVMYKYPMSAKHYLRTGAPGLGIHHTCRTMDAVFNEEELLKLTELHGLMLDVCADVGIEPTPVTEG